MTAVGLQRVGWHHPEAGGAALAAGAWALLLVPWVGGDAVRAAHERAHEVAPVPAGAAGWLLMVTAMMVPTALPAARHLGLNALWHRRRRTVALFLLGYVGVWAAFGAVAVPAAGLAEHLVGGGALLAGVLVAAAAWELTPWKWRFVRACHLIAPLPPRADRACLAGGLRYGRRCAGACWPVMLAMAVAGHSNLGLMVLLSLVVATEKLDLRPSRLAGLGAAVLLGAALVALATA